MAYSPDHSLAPASAAPSGAPSAASAPSAIPSGPPWPNPLASIAYASCRPADCEPPAEDSALTSRASYERLNRAAARAETLVLYRLDMLSGCRDSLDVDQTRLEQSIQNLWRLTAVRKTLISIEAALNSPTPTPQGAAPESELQSALAEVRRLLAEVSPASADSSLGARTSSSATASADHPAPASPEPPLPVVLSPSPSPSQSHSELESQSQSPSHSQSTPSTRSTGAMGSMGSLPSIESIPPVAPSPARPIAPSSLAIGSVPACPRMSLSSAARTLGRVNADMANYTEYVTTAADYASNLTAEEFLRPSLSPKSSSAPAHAHTHAHTSTHTPAHIPTPSADNSTSPLLADPGLSPSLKSQIATRNSSPCPPVALLPSRPISPSPPLHIPHSPHPPG